jgi:hypothetical protein
MANDFDMVRQRAIAALNKNRNAGAGIIGNVNTTPYYNSEANPGAIKTMVGVGGGNLQPSTIPPNLFIQDQERIKRMNQQLQDNANRQPLAPSMPRTFERFGINPGDIIGKRFNGRPPGTKTGMGMTPPARNIMNPALQGMKFSTQAPVVGPRTRQMLGANLTNAPGNNNYINDIMSKYGMIGR